MDDSLRMLLENISGQLNDLGKKLDDLAKNGCAKAADHERIASDHAEVFSRLRAVETAQAEGKGKFAVAAAVIGAVAAFALQWLGKHLP